MPSPSSAPSSSAAVRSRPVGVTLLTLYDGIMVGVVPILLVMIRFFQHAPSERPSVLVVFAAAMLSASVIYTAAGAWRGENSGRLGLLILTTIYYVGLVAGASFTMDLATLLTASDTGEVWLRGAQSLFWIGLHGAYFLGNPEARLFYGDVTASQAGPNSGPKHPTHRPHPNPFDRNLRRGSDRTEDER